MEGLTIKSDKFYTYEDYIKINDGQDYEVIGGKLIMVPKPKLYHQKIAYRLVGVLEKHTLQEKAGEVYGDVDVVFGDQVVSPDIVFISKDRLSITTETNIQGPPDLIIEVLSPSTQKYDRKEKSQLYYINGVKEYWTVDPALQLVEIFITSEKGWVRGGIYDENDILTSYLLPGLQIELNNIFSG